MSSPLLTLVEPVAERTRECSVCSREKSLACFYDRKCGRKGVLAQCRECRKTTQFKSKLKRLYGITPEDYYTLFVNQNGQCNICGIHQAELKNRLDTDHCHITGKVRGLLCHKCNKALGLFKDSSEILEKASKYLKGK